MPASGSLEVRVEAESVFVSNHLPYVVRDARHAVVHRGTVGTGSQASLPEGLYSVAILTPTGERASQLVHVEPDVTTPVIFHHADLDVHVDEPPQPPPVVHRLRPGAHKATAGPTSGTAGKARLVSTDRCTALDEDETGWTFAPATPLDAVPSALFDIGGRWWQTSLPLNPAATEPSLAICSVTVIDDAGTTRLRVAFGEARRVSRLVDGLVHNHAVTAGAEVLGSAADLLLHKYADPPGAVLGALTLHRIGGLAGRKQWVENLARDFAWLPDGQVLAAALLLKDADPAERRRGLGLLLAATTTRPMYTDGLSLATELLRRWPDDASEAERMQRVAALADYSSYADWESIPLCVDVTEEHR